MQQPLPRLDLSVSDFSENREESQIAEPLCTDGTTLENAADAQYAQCTPYAPGTCKSIHENFGKPSYLVDVQLKMLNFELYTYLKVF